MNLIPLNFITRAEQTPLRRMMLERALAGGGSLSEYEVTGNPVMFQTNVAQPLSGFTIPFLPVQQGTGDPSPDNIRPISGWAGLTAWRTGKNLVNIAPVKVTSQTVIGGYFTLKAGTYSFSVTVKNNSSIVGAMKITVNGTQVGLAVAIIADTTSRLKIQNIAIDKDSDIVGIVISGASVGYDFDISDVMVELGSTASPYTEYTGQSYPVTFPAVGKNLVNKADGKTSSSNWWIGSDKFNEEPDGTFVLDAGTYTFSASETQNGFYVRCNGVTVKTVYNNTKATFTLTEKAPVRLMLYKQGVTAEYWNTINIQLETGDTATAYEPFDNTVYGGTLDAVNGVLTVEYKYITENGSGQWGEVTSGGNRWYIGGITTDAETMDTTGVCNIGKLVNSFTPTGVAVQSNGRINLCGDLHNAFNDVAELKTFLSENPLQLVYKLATPIEIQLDPITVQTLIGDNTIWTDTNGENTVKYLKKG